MITLGSQSDDEQKSNIQKIKSLLGSVLAIIRRKISLQPRKIIDDNIKKIRHESFRNTFGISKSFISLLYMIHTCDIHTFKQIRLCICVQGGTFESPSSQCSQPG